MKTYIQFKASERNESDKDGVEENSVFETILSNVLLHLIPKNNPDFDSKIQGVTSWLIEFDASSGVPMREVGLDFEGRVIIKMPFGENSGYWTDNNLLIEDFMEYFNCESIHAQTFEEKWDTQIS